MKGFFISLDATVALSFILFAMVVIASESYNPRAPAGIYLKQLTMDTITVLEKTDGLEEAIKGNTTAVQWVLEATPELACMNIIMYNSTEDRVVDLIKSNCNSTGNLDIQITSRPVLYLNKKYVVKCISWFKKEPD